MDVDEATTLITEYRGDDGDLPATLFLSVDEFEEFLVDYTETNPLTDDPPKIKGVKVRLDRLIREPKVLPDSFGGSYPLWLKDPPEEHIRRLIDIEKQSFEDPLRGKIVQYLTHVWLKPFCRWQRFDDEMIEKYGDPLTTPTLSVPTGEEYEYTKTEFDHFERQKFGFEHIISPQLEDEAVVDEEQEGKISSAIHKYLWDVAVQPVAVRRERTFKGPYPVLDVEHTERLQFGKKMTTYEGLLMRRVDSNAGKLVYE